MLFIKQFVFNCKSNHYLITTKTSNLDKQLNKIKSKSKTMSRKRCYYEIMGLTTDATDEDIKKSYRQLALALHPDKNPDDIEMANNQFKLLQEAYDVLSDPRERKWFVFCI